MRSASHVLRDGRTPRIAAVVLLGYFAVEWVVSASWRGAFTYRYTTAGELGIPFCGSAGDVPCSSLYAAMDVGMIVVGLALLILAASWRALERVPAAASAALMIGALGLIGAGVVQQRWNYPLHMTLMGVFLCLGALGSLLIGLSAATRLPGAGRAVLALTGIVGTVAYFAYTGGLTGWLGPGGTQRAVVYPVLIGLTVAGLLRGTESER